MTHQIFSKSVCERLRGLRDSTWVIFTNCRAWSYGQRDAALAAAEREKASIAIIDYRIACEKRIEELEAALQHAWAGSSDTEKKLDHLERLVEGEGWQWMDSANCYTPHTAKCQRCRVTAMVAGDDTRDIDPFASIATVESERVQRRNMRAGV